MGGFDTKGRFHVHWGAAEHVRRAARGVGPAALRPAGAGPGLHAASIRSTSTAVDGILEEYDYDPHRMLAILEAIQASLRLPARGRPQARQPVSGAPYALIYGTATYYRHLRFEQRRADGRRLPVHGLPDAGRGRIAGALAGRARDGARPPAGRRAESPWSRLPDPHPRRRRRRSSRSTASRSPSDHAGAAAWARALAGEDRGMTTTEPRRSSPTPARFPRLLLPATAAGRSDRPRRGRRRPAPSPRCGRASSDLKRRRRHRRPDRVRACAGAAAAASRSARSGAPAPPAADARDRRVRRRQRLPVRPGRHDRPRPAGDATRTPSSRARPSPPSRSARGGRRRGPGRGAGRDPGRRGGRRRRRGGRLPRRGRPRAAARRSTVSVRPLQGAYMLGEETVLLKGLEGKRGQPEQRPPYTTSAASSGRPTLIHNAADASRPCRPILSGGIAGFRRDRRPDAFAGTVLVQISGAVADARHRRGADRRHAPRDPRRWPAACRPAPAQGPPRRRPVGRHPAGRARSASASTTTRSRRPAPTSAPARSWSLRPAPASWTWPRLLTRFCADEACGKTIPCRIGLRRLAEIGARICEGQPRGDEIGAPDRPLGRHRRQRPVRPRASRHPRPR